jgi:acyl-CoA thioesterase-1
MRTVLLAFPLFTAVLLAACGGASRNNASRGSVPPPGAQPAGAAAPGETLPKIVAFGDSLTAGYGLSPAESYPSLLQKMLDADGFKYEVVNAGVSGDTSAGGVQRIDWSLDAGGVRFVILELGANDFLRGQPITETRKNLSAIIERSKSRGARVLLAGMYTTTEVGSDYERQIDEGFKLLAKEQDVTLIPFFLEGVAGKTELNQQDGIHPNAEGTRLVAATVYRYLKPMLEEERKK